MQMTSSPPEYFNHVLMRFGHHLSSFEQQSYTKQFSGMIQSSTQGSTLCMKPSSANVGSIHKISSTHTPVTGSVPVVHQSFVSNTRITNARSNAANRYITSNNSTRLLGNPSSNSITT
ncbi:hypothetical protein K492DRAFT_173318 [Lichtheimia hyalospora FSU 10163]|nr:hypothetical protein K492DRAFT_173318 [Lichtheimia hyalospora FSU 10163]